MATKQISQLPAATVMNDGDLLVCEQNGVAKRLTGSILMAMINSHGGITGSSYTPPVAPSLQGTLTLTFTDGTSTEVPIVNGAKGATGATGAQGEKGDPFTFDDFTPEQLESLRGEQGVQGNPGNPGYCHIKWSADYPTSDNDMSDVPDAWMGIYSGTSSAAPTRWQSYLWYKIKGDKGADGVGWPGERGSYIWQSNYPVRGSTYQWYFLLSDLVAPTTTSGVTPRVGDMAIYGDNYYVFSSLSDGDKYYVGAGHSLNSAALPSGGTTGQVLAKASGNDYDVEWKDAGSGDLTVTYGSTDYGAMRTAWLEGKELRLYYSNHNYALLSIVGTLTEGTAIFTCTDDSGVLYWAKAERESGVVLNTTWTNGSIDLASGGGGTTDYDDLDNQPSINSVTLSGNKTAADLSLASAADLAAKITAPSSPATGAFLVWNGSAWTAQTLSTWQGGNY